MGCGGGRGCSGVFGVRWAAWPPAGVAGHAADNNFETGKSVNTTIPFREGIPYNPVGQRAYYSTYVLF
jgi:hypothetical protein